MEYIADTFWKKETNILPYKGKVKHDAGAYYAPYIPLNYTVSKEDIGKIIIFNSSNPVKVAIPENLPICSNYYINDSIKNKDGWGIK